MNAATLTDQQLDTELDRALAELRMADFHTLGDEADRRLADKRARLARPEALLVAARWYAGHHIAVFPCEPGGKRPLTRNGFKDATTDLEQIERWWAATPQANIGLPTGRRFDVIDIDGPDGYRSFGLMREEGILPPVLAWAATPRGGQHAYILPTGDGNAANVRPGVDYRGRGGYVIAAPSIGPTGARYDWLTPLNPTELQA